MTNGEPKPRWIELQKCKAVSQHSGGVSITAIADVFRSRGIETSDINAAKFEDAGYDNDFYAWTQAQAGLLRSGQFSKVDIENVAEELESMGRSDKRELDSRLEILLMHLLKWQIQVRGRSPGWSGTIREQRRRIEKLLRESPSLRPIVGQLIPEAFTEARDKAAEETGLAETTFPSECPFSLEQILAEDFLPED